MKSYKIQVILPEAGLEKFKELAKKENRSFSNMARKLIMEGLLRLEDKK